MPTILIKKSDTPGAAPTGSDLTNLAGGAEIAVNTADKRVFSMNSSSAIIELGTNPGSLTTADASATVFRSGSATITNLIATTATISDLSATVSRIGSGTVTQLTSTSASITTLTATSASVTNLTATSLVLSNLSIASANVTTLTSGSATITNLLATSLTVSSGSTLNGGVVVNELGADVDFRIESDTDANAFFLDAGNSRVGIGTSFPLAKIHCVFTDSTTTNLASGAGIFINNSDTTTGTLAPLLFSTDSGGRARSAIAHVDTGAFGKGDLAFYTMSNGEISGSILDTGDEKMRLTADGNVGIGTSSPNSYTGWTTVTINGTDGSEIDFEANNTLYGDMYASSVIMAIRSRAAIPLAFSTDSVERARITSTGELLVGGTTAISLGSAINSQSTGGGNFICFRNDTSISTGNEFGGFFWYGNDTTSNTPTIHAWTQAIASGTHSAGDNPTDVVFGTTPDGSETVAEAGRITQAGSYVLKGGTTTAAAGVGIIFPATQVASANANSLDDYEEGTWTPTVRGSSTAGTYTLSNVYAYYTKIGNQVTVWARFGFSAASGGTGDLIVEGLPFNYRSNPSLVGAATAANLNTTAASSNGLAVGNNSSSSDDSLVLALTIDNSSFEIIAIGAVGVSTTLAFSFSYTV